MTEAEMTVEVRYLNYISEVAGRKAARVDLQAGTKLIDLVKYLGQLHGPRLASVLMDEQSVHLNRFLLIFINQNHTREAEIQLNDGDVVVFSTIVAGG